VSLIGRYKIVVPCIKCFQISVSVKLYPDTLCWGTTSTYSIHRMVVSAFRGRSVFRSHVSP